MFKKLAPGFIHRLDSYLVKNHPNLWMSRIHYVLWHSLVVWLLSAACGLLLPLGFEEVFNYGLWYFIFLIPGIVLLVAWVYNYVIFNKEKLQGQRRFYEEYLNFILAFVVILLFMLTPLPFQYFYAQREINFVSDQEFVNDINILNENEAYLPFKADLYEQSSRYDNNNEYEVNFNVSKINSDRCGYYTPGSFYLKDFLLSGAIKKDIELAESYRVIRDRDELVRRIELFKKTAEKYGVKANFSADDCAGHYLKFLKAGDVNVNEIPENSNYFSKIEDVVRNVSRAKSFHKIIDEKEYPYVIFYISLLLTILVVLFKLTSWRQYLLMCVVMMFYPLLVFIFSQLLPRNLGFRNDTAFTLLISLYLLVSMVSILLSLRNRSGFSPVLNILNQVFFVAMSFIPAFIMILIHEYTSVFIKRAESEADNSEYYLLLKQDYTWWINFALFFGVGLFFLCLPAFKRFFTNQLALPRKS